MIQVHRPRFVVIEELPQFEKHGLTVLMGSGVLGSLHDFSHGIMNPRKLGLPVGRPRLYCIGVLRGVATIEGIVKDLVQQVCGHTGLQGTGADFFFSDLPHATLSPALAKTLKGYERLHGHGDQFFLDLMQTPTTRPRTLLKDGSLPVLTRGCKFFAQRCSRVLSGTEALIAQGWALHRSMRGSAGSLSDVFANQSDR